MSHSFIQHSSAFAGRDIRHRVFPFERRLKIICTLHCLNCCSWTQERRRALMASKATSSFNSASAQQKATRIAWCRSRSRFMANHGGLCQCLSAMSGSTVQYVSFVIYVLFTFYGPIMLNMSRCSIKDVPSKVYRPSR